MKKLLNVTFAFLLVSIVKSYGQLGSHPAFGVKVGGNRMFTNIKVRPNNLVSRLSGIQPSEGFQVGTWATFPINKWLFIETDLDFQQRQNQYGDPTDKTKVVAVNTFNYLGLSGRIGGTYKNIYLTVGPRAVVLLSKKVLGGEGTQAAEWGADVRLGYQYKRFRLEAFYQQSFSHYHQIVFLDPVEKKNLFMAKTAGITLGFRLFGKGK